MFPALIVFLFAFDALQKDPETPNNDIEAWVFITIAVLIWPITLPSILRKKISDLFSTEEENQIWRDAI